MRILSITAQKPHSTGSGTYLTELVRSFDRAGHSQAVVCGIFPDDSVSFPEGVTCYPVYFSSRTASSDRDSLLYSACKNKSFSLPAIPFPVVGMSDIMPYESTRYRDLTPAMIRQFEEAFIPAVQRAVTDLDPDLILCHHLFLLTAMIRKHFPDRRIFGISHGTDLRQMMNCPDLAEMIRPYVSGLDRFLALHGEQKSRIAEIFGVPDDRITVIGSGYNSMLFNTDGRLPRSAGDPVRICYAGKMSRPKGVPELLKVFSLLADDDAAPAFTVDMAGGCQDEKVLHALEKLPDNIRWHGQIAQTDLASLFRSCDVFVLPSYFEGLPLVLIEAMASGMIPVSTDLPGVKPWIESNVRDQNVIFVPRPEMASIDTPTEEGRAKFTEDLFTAVRTAAVRTSSQPSCLLSPDTSGITWDSVAERILREPGLPREQVN